jgi:3-deoxy-7-phosphoheptulonate synthase
MVEVHPNPERALSDGPQSLRLPQFEQLMKELQPYTKLWQTERASTLAAALVGRT